MKTRFGLPGVCATVLILAACGKPSAVSLTDAHTTLCQGPFDTRPWSDFLSRPTEFAQTGIQVNSTDWMRVDAVSLVGASQLQLVSVAFVPGGPTGNAFPYADGTRASTFPDKWALRHEMPGVVLTRLTASREELSRNPMATTWQMVIGVLPTSTVGFAKGTRIVYSIHGIRRTFVGHDAVQVANLPYGC